MRLGVYRVIFAHGLDDEAGDAGLLEVGEEYFDGFRRGVDANDTGELAGEADQSAFLPAAVVACDGFGEGLDQAGAVRTEDSHDDGMAHVGIGSQVTADARTKRAGSVLFLPPSLCKRSGRFRLRQVISIPYG
jgi:hypothetical protein